MPPIPCDLSPLGLSNCSGMFYMGTSISDKTALSSPINRAFEIVPPSSPTVQLVTSNRTSSLPPLFLNLAAISPDLIALLSSWWGNPQDICTVYFLGRLRLFLFLFICMVVSFLYSKVDSTRLWPLGVRDHIVSILNIPISIFHRGHSAQPLDLTS